MSLVNALALLVLCTLALTGCGCLTIDWDKYFESGNYSETLDMDCLLIEEAILIDDSTGREVERTSKLKPVLGNGYRVIGYKADFKHEGANDKYWYRIELKTIDGRTIDADAILE